MGAIGIVTSGYQFYSAETLDKKVEYGFDILIGSLGFIKGVGTGVSLYWSFGGKELHYMYVERVLITQVQMGINPGLPVYQPFK